MTIESEACPECVASPHSDQTEPHAHVTAYGYLVYAPIRGNVISDTLAAGYNQAIARLTDERAYNDWWVEAKKRPDAQYDRRATRERLVRYLQDAEGS